MAKAGADPVAIARAFAVTEKHVYRRLALADLPAPVLDALAADEITLSHAAAFTVCNDEALALDVLDRCRGQNWSDYSLKSALQPGSVTTNDRRLRFVGLEAYIEAGGTTARDLFSETVYLAETDILEGLFAAKVETLKADFMAEGWAFAHFHPESYLGMIDRDLQASRMRPIPGVLTEEEAAEFDDLSELEEAEALDEAGEARMAELLVKMEGDFSAEQRALSGIVFYIDQRGAVSAHAGMVRKQELAQAKTLETESARFTQDITPFERKKREIETTLADERQAYEGEIVRLDQEKIDTDRQIHDLAEKERQDKASEGRIGAILRGLGWEKTRRQVGGVRARPYLPPAPPAPPSAEGAR